MKPLKIIFDMIANIICNKETAVEKLTESDLEYIWEISQRHDVSHIISKELERGDYSNESLMMQNFKKSQTIAIYR